jgi:hypothetical protein
MFTIKPSPWGMRVWALAFILLQTSGSYALHNPAFQPILCDLMNSVLGASVLLWATLEKLGLEYCMNQMHVSREASAMTQHSKRWGKPAVIPDPPSNTKSPVELVSCQAMWLYLFHKERENVYPVVKTAVFQGLVSPFLFNVHWA